MGNPASFPPPGNGPSSPVVVTNRCPECRRLVKVRAAAQVGDVLHQCDKAQIVVDHWGAHGPVSEQRQIP